LLNALFVAPPVLSLVRGGEVRQSSTQFAQENLQFRVQVARIGVAEDRAALDASCEKLSRLCRSVNTAVRTLDLERDPQVGDLCFSTRVRIAELGRNAVLRRTPQVLRESRRALHASLAFLLMTLAPALEPAAAATAEPRPPLTELAAVVCAALRENPLDAAWLVELAETELILAENERSTAALGREAAWQLLELQNGIADWNQNGRTGAVAVNLVESLLHVLEATRA
jgi:hypothetical protein